MKADIIWINREGLRSMQEEASVKFPRETGGCFIGYYLEKNVELVITNIIGPGPSAIHKKHYFKPDADWQEKEIERIYSESGRLQTYLGDWHVHTIPNERLSWKDKKTLRHIAKYKPARIKTPIMGIMCFSDEWELTIWQLQKMNSFFIFDKSIYKKLDLRLFWKSRDTIPPLPSFNFSASVSSGDRG